MGELFLMIVAAALPLMFLAPFPARARAICCAVGIGAVYLILDNWFTGPHDPRPLYVLAIGVGFFLRAILDGGLFAVRQMRRRAGAHG